MNEDGVFGSPIHRKGFEFGNSGPENYPLFPTAGPIPSVPFVFGSTSHQGKQFVPFYFLLL